MHGENMKLSLARLLTRSINPSVKSAVGIKCMYNILQQISIANANETLQWRQNVCVPPVSYKAEVTLNRIDTRLIKFDQNLWVQKPKTNFFEMCRAVLHTQWFTIWSFSLRFFLLKSIRNVIKHTRDSEGSRECQITGINKKKK